MLKLKMLILAIALFSTSQCSAPNSTRQISNVNQTSTTPINYKSFILGTWEGRAWDNGQANHLVMYLTFTGNNLTVDYSPSGGAKFTVPYRFKDEKIIEANRYPESLIIEREADDEIKFRPEGDKLRVDIEVIYECRFTRAKK